MEPGADLMLLHPDGKEELLVEGGDGSITDPMVSFDGQWVYYSHIHNLKKASQWNPPRQGADIYKIHVQVEEDRPADQPEVHAQHRAPPTGRRTSARRKQGKSHFEYGVYNMGPCPLPGGRIVFTSNRDGFRPAKGYPAVALQLFVMDDRDTDIGDDEDPPNLEKIGHLNLAGALHPVVLKDGRIMYSTLESQGNRSDILWGIWTIHPDGTNWDAARQRVRSRRRAERLPLPDAAFERRDRLRGVLQPEQQRLRRLHARCRRVAAGAATRPSARRT